MNCYRSNDSTYTGFNLHSQFMSINSGIYKLVKCFLFNGYRLSIQYHTDNINQMFIVGQLCLVLNEPDGWRWTTINKTAQHAVMKIRTNEQVKDRQLLWLPVCPFQQRPVTRAACRRGPAGHYHTPLFGHQPLNTQVSSPELDQTNDRAACRGEEVGR